MSDDDTESDFGADLETLFVEEFDADADTAAAAAERAAAFREDWAEDLTVAALRERLAGGEYDAFTNRFNYAIGDLAAEAEDCTDSREYRLGGFGDLAADPEQGT